MSGRVFYDIDPITEQKSMAPGLAGVKVAFRSVALGGFSHGAVTRLMERSISQTSVPAST